jgi:hypothetical protein
LELKDYQVIVDATGAGTGVDDILKQDFGPRVLGVNYSESASERKIMMEDDKTPYELYERLYSELWFALRKWIEFDYLKFSGDFSSPELVTELTNRRFLQKGSGKLQVEPKKEYKARGNDSPDRGDSLSLLVHLARLRADELQAIFSDAGGAFDIRRIQKIDHHFQSEYIDFENNEPLNLTKNHPMDEYAEKAFDDTGISFGDSGLF